MTLDRLNDAWNTTFWSHTFTDWDEIEPPTALSEHWRGPNHTAFQGITLDYRRFMSDALLGGFLAEKAAIRAHVPDTPVTTNLMGLYQPDRLPPLGRRTSTWRRGTTTRPRTPRPSGPPPGWRWRTARCAACAAARPFWVMEQTPSTTASRDVNAVKRPGVLALWTWQSVAHGADATLFFQLRQSRGACEKYHGAVLDHAGRTDTRVFREVAALGAQLAALGDATLGARTPARVALLLDWDSWWAVEMSDGPNRNVRYLDVLGQLPPGAVGAQRAASTSSRSRRTSTGTTSSSRPLLHMVKGDLASRLEAVVERGGSLLTTFLSGRVDEDDNAFLADAPGPLRDLLGLRVEETDAQQPSVVNPVTLERRDVRGPARVRGRDPRRRSTVVGRRTAPTSTPAPRRSRARPAATARPGTSRRRSTTRAWRPSCGASWTGTGSWGRSPTSTASRWSTASHREGARYTFVLHHGPSPVTVTSEVAGTDLLTGRRVELGDPLTLSPTEVLVLS